MVSGVPVTFISVGEDVNDGALGGFLDMTNFLLGESNPPQVLTTSYGENEDVISRPLAKWVTLRLLSRIHIDALIPSNLCTAYAQLGARGTSILFSSGDGGVSGSQPASCSNFVPTFPSGCPL